jgi:ATP-dependent Clp protease protease subunit
MTDEVTDNENTLNLIDLKTKFIIQHHVDIDVREMWIEGRIDNKSFIKFDKHLRLLETFNEEEVTVYINSMGGSVYSMFAFIDRIKSSTMKVHMIGTGVVASAAVLILAAGFTRKVTRYTSLMHHGASFELDNGKIHTQDNEIKHIKDLEVRACKFLASVTNKPYNFWTATGKHLDHYFDADTALEYGLVDEIL